MKKLKIYLDTSVISHLQADDVPEKMAITHKFWNDVKSEDYDVYISEVMEAVLPPKCVDDSLHVAAATVIGCNAIVS